MSTGDEGVGQEWGEEEAGKRTREGGGECERVSMHLSVCVCARSFVYVCVCTLLDGRLAVLHMQPTYYRGFNQEFSLFRSFFLYHPLHIDPHSRAEGSLETYTRGGSEGV